MNATKDSIAQFARDNGITMESVFVPWSQSRNKDEKSQFNKDKEQRSLNWKITIKKDGREVLTTDYSAGVAHCPSYPRYNHTMTVDLYEKIIWETEKGFRARGDHMLWSDKSKKIVPHIADVLHSLVLDGSVLNNSTFEEWASEFGYDTDSRKAETIYRQCLEIALKLRNGLGEDLLQALQKATQDY